MVSKTASKGAASSTEGSAKTKMQTIHFITYQTESVSLKVVFAQKYEQNTRNNEEQPIESMYFFLYCSPPNSLLLGLPLAQSGVILGRKKNPHWSFQCQ